MGYRSNESEPDVLIKRVTTDNGTAYYKYMLAYVNYVLHLTNYVQEYMLELNQSYRLKEVFVPPDIYLGANVDKVQLEDGRTVCSTTCVDYLRGYTKNVDSIIEVNKAALKSSGDRNRPYPSSYKTELEVTNELYEDLTNRFQKLIRVLRCSIELGRLDIMTEVSFLSTFMLTS